jgi:MFS family permease
VALVPRGPSAIFYGWWIAVAFAVMAFLSSGIRFTIGPFLKPVVADLGIDRASFSFVASVGLLLYGAFIPVVGRLVDRVGARPVTVAGALLLALSLAATGQVRTFWQLLVVFGVWVALGLAATGHVVGSAVVSRWFTRRRATALSLLGSASMAGMSLLVPATMWLILTLGWRVTYGLLGLLMLVLVLPLGLWVVRESPESMGLAPDGLPATPSAPAPRLEERTAMASALQASPFWHLAGGMFTCGFSMSLLSAHGVPMLTDHGYHPMLASWALGVLGGTSMACAIALGALGDRFGRRPVLAWLYGTRAILFAALFLIRDGPAELLLVAALGGVSMSGTLAMSSALTADIFGRFSVGSIFGAVFLVHQVGAATGSWLGGFLFELTGGYGPAFTVASLQLLAGAVLSVTIDERARCAPRLAPATAPR